MSLSKKLGCNAFYKENMEMKDKADLNDKLNHYKILEKPQDTLVVAQQTAEEVKTLKRKN